MFEMTRLWLTIDSSDIGAASRADAWADIGGPLFDELQEAGLLEFHSEEEREKVRRVPPTVVWDGGIAKLQLYWNPGRYHSTVAVECKDWAAPVPAGWHRILRSTLVAETRGQRLFVNGKSVFMSRPGTVFMVEYKNRVHRFYLDDDQSARLGVRFLWSQYDATTQMPCHNIEETWVLPPGVTLVPA